MNQTIMLTTTNCIEGFKIDTYLGIVSESIVVGTNFLSDLAASFSDIFGGKSRSYQNELSNLKDIAINGLIKKAKGKGANGIIGISFDTDEISGAGKSMFMINVVGTAVKITQKDDHSMEALSSNVSGDVVSDHMQLKTIDERFYQDDFQLTMSEIDLLLRYNLLAKIEYFMESLKNIKVTLNSAEKMRHDYHISSLINYLGKEERSEQILKFYSVIPKYLGLREEINRIAKALGLVDYKRLLGWLNSDNINLQHISLQILKIIKYEYSSEDIFYCQSIIEFLKYKYSENSLEENEKKMEMCVWKI